MNYLKTFSCLTIMIIFSCAIFAQTPVSYRKPAPQRAIPSMVLESFQMQYGDAFVKGWFVTHITYWQNDYSSAWYTDWYGVERTVIVYTYEQPAFYEVEFVENPGELSRAIYNIYGYWYETRTQIKGLPMAIYDAIRASKYANWKISPVMEKIVNPAWPKEVYRFLVSKGMQAQIIRMEPDGKVIQAKQIGEE